MTEHHQKASAVAGAASGSEEPRSSTRKAAELTKGAGQSTAGDKAGAKTAPSAKDQRPVEIGGQSGPEPTRYGDWEKGGIASDF